MRVTLELRTTFRCTVCRRLYDQQERRKTQRLVGFIGAPAFAICPSCGMPVFRQTKGYIRRAQALIKSRADGSLLVTLCATDDPARAVEVARLVLELMPDAGAILLDTAKADAGIVADGRFALVCAVGEDTPAYEACAEMAGWVGENRPAAELKKLFSEKWPTPLDNATPA